MNTSRHLIDHIQLTTAKPFAQVKADFERPLGKFDPKAQAMLAAGENPARVRTMIEAMAGPSGFMVFAVYDHGAVLRLVGQECRSLQYVVGNPLFAMEMTRHAIGASLYAPLRVLLYESAAGQACLEYDRPSSLFGQFGNDQVARIAASLDEKMEKLAALAIG